MKLVAVACTDKNGGIGKSDSLALPWHVPSELMYFKKLTTAHPVLMGYKTFQSLKGPLEGRQNIVLTHSPRQIEGVTVITSPRDLHIIPLIDDTVFIIGGLSLYELFLRKVDKIYLSVLPNDYNCDIFFPPFKDNFRSLMQEIHFGFKVIIYERK